jgi:hypothetical protein
MSTTPNYNFPLIEPTDFVTNLPADFEAFADDVDSTIKALDDDNIKITAFVAKGDLLGASDENTPARLGVGANGTILTADSTEATGLKWDLPPTGGSTFTLLNTGGTTLNGSQAVTVTGISGVSKLFIYVSSARSGTTGIECRVQFNSDTASNYTSTGILVSTGASYNPNLFSGLNPTPAAHIYLGKCSDNSGSILHGYLFVEACQASGLMPYHGAGGASANTSNAHELVATGGFYDAAAAITSVTFRNNKANFNQGTIFIYGSA